MNNRINLQREAARSALQLRRSRSIPREHPVNVYDLAAATGVQVQFLDLPSLEGMFYRGPDPKIFLPSLNHRSRGRVSFTCAHELGHFQLGHGTRVDEYLDSPEVSEPKSDDEIAADTFASTLLMPRPAVLKRFECRGISLESASPADLFIASCELDVGYSTLLNHLRFGLQLVDDEWLVGRKNVAPKFIRENLAGVSDVRRVVVVDEHWAPVPIDLEVGDYVVVPEGAQLKPEQFLDSVGVRGAYRSLKAVRPGQCTIRIGDSAPIVRIARAGFIGLFQYRFFEEVESE